MDAVSTLGASLIAISLLASATAQLVSTVAVLDEPPPVDATPTVVVAPIVVATPAPVEVPSAAPVVEAPAVAPPPIQVRVIDPLAAPPATRIEGTTSAESGLSDPFTPSDTPYSSTGALDPSYPFSRMADPFSSMAYPPPPMIRNLPPPSLPPPAPPAKASTGRRFFIGGYGGLSTRLSPASRKMGAYTGIRGGLMLGRRISLGGSFYNLGARFGAPIVDSDGRDLDLSLRYGGFAVGLAIVDRRTFQFALQSLFGGGTACISVEDEDYCIESIRFTVIEPGAALYFVPARWFRLGFEGGYRFAMKYNWQPPNFFPMSGGYGGISVEFGRFR